MASLTDRKMYDKIFAQNLADRKMNDKIFAQNLASLTGRKMYDKIFAQNLAIGLYFCVLVPPRTLGYPDAEAKQVFCLFMVSFWA